MRKIIALLMVAVMAFGFCSCKGTFGSDLDDAKKALKSECGAEKASKDQYKLMTDSQYANKDIADDFAKGAYAEISSKDFTFFKFHSVVDHSKIKSCFKYLKIDPKSLDNDSVTSMEVLIVEFKDKESAQSYYDALYAKKESAYKDVSFQLNIDSDFKGDEKSFVYGNKSDFMVFHAYAAIEKNVVVYAFLEGPVNDEMEKEYKAFIDKMKYEYADV